MAALTSLSKLINDVLIVHTFKPDTRNSFSVVQLSNKLLETLKNLQCSIEMEAFSQ